MNLLGNAALTEQCTATQYSNRISLIVFLCERDDYRVHLNTFPSPEVSELNGELAILLAVSISKSFPFSL